jgi:UDP-glucose 4-epimerase
MGRSPLVTGDADFAPQPQTEGEHFDMKAIVTGAAGFIGSHVATVLVEQGHDVLAIDNLSGGIRENVPAKAQFIERSILDPLDDIFSNFGPEVVYHLAAYAAEGLSHHIPTFNYVNNVVGTANVVAASVRSHVRHFVFTSSIAVYGHPTGDSEFTEESTCKPCDPYGTAKLACEHHIRGVFQYFGRPSWTIFRPHNVFGPRQNISDPYRNVVGIFMARGMLGQPMPVFGDGLQTRSFSYIDTVSSCIANAPFLPDARNQTINVGGDESMTVRDLAQAVSRVLGIKPQLDFFPSRNEVQHAHCSHDRARAFFPATYKHSIGIEDGLARMATHVRSVDVPPSTECPAEIEIMERLPPSWAERLRGSPGMSRG